MILALYNAALTAAAPLGAAWLACSPRHRRLLQRFFPTVTHFAAPPLWLHACSVGEVNAARLLLGAMRKRWPSVPRLLTVSTLSGWEIAQSLQDVDGLAFFPFDHPVSVQIFLNRAKPRALVLLETELWPNVMRTTDKRGIPVVVASGRLSDRCFRSYERAACLFRPVLVHLAAAGMQSEEYARRIQLLGARPERISVTGNVKFDIAPAPVDTASVRALKEECGFSSDAPVLVFGSTRPGDELLAARCWAALRDEFPDLCIVVAPRHLDRLGEAMAAFREPIRRRTDGPGSAEARRVFFLDTLGELLRFYAMATIAVVCGSFYPGVGGHNPIEPAALGIPVVFGPHMEGFAGVAEALLDAGGAYQAPTADALPELLARLLSEGDLGQVGHCARQAVAANQGAIDRTLDLIAKTVPDLA